MGNVSLICPRQISPKQPELNLEYPKKLQGPGLECYRVMLWLDMVVMIYSKP